MISKLLFNKTCLGCGRGSSVLCKTCIDSYVMSLDIRVDEGGHMYFCDYGGLYKKFILTGKYRFDKKVFKIVGDLVRSQVSFENGAFGAYVPLSWNRFCFRGFNQARVIAFGSGLPVRRVLKRVKFDGSLTGMDREERLDYMSSVFECRNLDLSRFKVCYLFDDVYTTGATLKAAKNCILDGYPNLQVRTVSFAKTKKLFEPRV